MSGLTLADRLGAMRVFVVALVAAASVFVAAGCSDRANTARAQPAVVPAVTPTALPTTIPVSVPTPTTVSSTPVPLTALSPTPTPTQVPPIEPDRWLERMGSGGLNGSASLVVVDGRYGVWTSGNNGENWTLHPVPGSDKGTTCAVATSTRVASIRDPWSDTPALVLFDLSTKEWTERPAPQAASWKSLRGLCSGIEIGGRLVWTAHHDGALWFFVEEGSTYRAIEIAFPVEEFPSAEPGYVSQLLYESDANRLVVASKNFEGDCSPYANLHGFSVSILDELGAIVWEDAVVERLNTEPVVGDQRILTVGDELWTMDQIEPYAEFRFQAGCGGAGRWAAGPLGSEPAPFPRGFMPKLYSVDGTVFAEVPLIDLSTIPQDTLGVRVFADWFEFDRTAGSWARIDSPSDSYGEVDRPFVSTLTDPLQAVAD